MAADSATPEEGRGSGDSGGGGDGGGGGGGDGGGGSSKEDSVLDQMPSLHMNATVTTMSIITVNVPVSLLSFTS